ACASLTGNEMFASDGDVATALKAQAADLVDSLTLERIQAQINDEMIQAIEIKGPPDTHDVAGSIRPSIEGSITRIADVGSGLTDEELDRRVAEARTELEKALEGDDWLAVFPGRRILRLFVNTHLNGVAYEPFRNVVLDKIAMSDQRPASMQQILDRILEA